MNITPPFSEDDIVAQGGTISAYFNSSLAAIREDEVDVETSHGEIITLKNDFVLAMTGYKPDFSFLMRIGVELVNQEGQCTPKHDPDTLETNIPGIFLAGVICGGTVTNKWFIENSRVHADIAVHQIILRKHRLEHMS